jgi:hypothetical protein
VSFCGEKGVEGLPDAAVGASQAEKDEVEALGVAITEEADTLYALKEVLGQLAVFCATARLDFHVTVVKNGLSFATTVMDDLEFQGQKGGNSGMDRAVES